MGSTTRRTRPRARAHDNWRIDLDEVADAWRHPHANIAGRRAFDPQLQCQSTTELCKWRYAKWPQPGHQDTRTLCLFLLWPGLVHEHTTIRFVMVIRGWAGGPAPP